MISSYLWSSSIPPLSYVRNMLSVTGCLSSAGYAFFNSLSWLFKFSIWFFCSSISYSITIFCLLYLFFFLSSFLSFSNFSISLSSMNCLWFIVTLYCNSDIRSSYSCFNPSNINRFSSSTSLILLFYSSNSFFLYSFNACSWSLDYWSSYLFSFWFSFFSKIVFDFIVLSSLCYEDVS